MIEKEKLLKCIEENPDATQEQIAEILGTKAYIIRYSMKQYGIKWQKKSGGKRIVSEEKLRDFIEANPEATQAQIAKHFNTTTSAINRSIRAYGISKISNNSKKTVLIPKNELEEYIKNNPEKKRWEIAIHFGVSEWVVGKSIERYGLNLEQKGEKRRKTRIPKEELEQYIRENPDKYQWEIARHFKVSNGVINTMIREYGIKWNTPRKTHAKQILASREVLIQKAIIFMRQNPKASVETVESLFRAKLKKDIELRRLLEEKKEELLNEGQKYKVVFIQSLLDRGQRPKTDGKDER